MNENQGIYHESAFVKIGRFLGRSRSSQLLASIAVAASFSYLAYAAWHARDLAAAVLTIGLLSFGFQWAWRLLPIPNATRTRWVREQQIAEQCPAYYYRGAFWAGTCLAAMEFWRADSTKPLDYSAFIVSGILTAIGAISYILCRRFIRKERNCTERHNP